MVDDMWLHRIVLMRLRKAWRRMFQTKRLAICRLCLENFIYKVEIISEVEELRWEGIKQTMLQDHEKYVR